MKKNVNVNLNKRHTLSQIVKIKRLLLKGQSITPLQALKRFGCLRLGARIYDLEREPYNMTIDRTMVLTRSGKWVMKYFTIQYFRKKDKKKRRK